MRGKGKMVPHARNAKDEDRKINEVHLDYCFMSSGGDDTSVLTILVAKERDTGMTCSTVVPRKGATGEFAAKRIVAFIREIGCEFVTVIVKSDQEPAIQALIEDVRRMTGEVKQ